MRDKDLIKEILSPSKYADDVTYAAINRKSSESDRNGEKKQSSHKSRKIEEFEVAKPPPTPTPPPSMETFIHYKHDKILLSELDRTFNYHTKVEDKTPNWKKCKLLGSHR